MNNIQNKVEDGRIEGLLELVVRDSEVELSFQSCWRVHTKITQMNRDCIREKGVTKC